MREVVYKFINKYITNVLLWCILCTVSERYWKLSANCIHIGVFLCTRAHTHTHTHTQRDNAERVEWCLQWLADKAGVENLLHRVYEVEALLCELSAHLDGRAPTLYQAQDLLKTSVYDHERGTR